MAQVVTAESRARKILERLSVEPVTPGACTGAGGWLQEEEGRPRISYNPANGQPLATVIEAGPATYDQVSATAAAAFLRWRTVPAPTRGQLVRDLGQALRQAKEPLGELVTLQMGKIRDEGLGEVQEMIDICDFAVGLSRQLYGLTMHSERPQHRMYEQWHPLGPVGIISAFNFPVAVWSWNAALAAVCGDTMIWKPSSSTPLAAIAVQHICNQVSADFGWDGLFCLVIGPGREVGERMIQDPRVPLISFTGSVRRGRHVATRVAERLGRSILELGGNNAIVISRQADLELATRAIVFGAVGTAGQRCTTTRRIIVHQDVSRRLTRRLIAAYRQLEIGDPIRATTLVGPLVNEEAVESMFRALETAQAQGGKILWGGRRLPEKGTCYVEPAIVKMPSQTPIVCEETFAPILYLLEFQDLEQAVALHNGVPQGLSSAIFTTDLREAEYFLSVSGSDCGLANVNIGTSGAEIGGAFGGEKETGGGRESGSDCWKAYMRRQTNTLNWSRELPLAQGIQFG